MDNNANCGNGAFLSNPAGTPQQLVLNGTNEAARTYFFMDDACGLASNNGSVSSATGTPMTVTGITAQILREFLKTNALIIGGYNFQTTSAPTLSNNLNVIYTNLDGNTKIVQLFSAKSVSNMQQNPLLLNVVQPFVYTNTTALKIAVPAGVGTVSYTFTFDIIDSVPYGQLSDWLAINKIPSKSAMGC